MASLTCAPGESGLGQHRFNEDRERAFDSLARLDDLDADVVLFGRGVEWTQGVPLAPELGQGRCRPPLVTLRERDPGVRPRWAPLVLLDLGGSGCA